MVIRIGFLVISFVNLIFTSLGINPVPVSDSVAYELISVVLTAGSAFWNAWKNNNFTLAAKTAQKILEAMKKGRITKDKVEEYLK